MVFDLTKQGELHCSLADYSKLQESFHRVRCVLDDDEVVLVWDKGLKIAGYFQVVPFPDVWRACDAFSKLVWRPFALSESVDLATCEKLRVK
jgi:hypothetical protein